MKTNAASAKVEARMLEELKKEVEEAATLLGSSFTGFATRPLVEREREVKQWQGPTVLCDEARDSFVDMMANPPAPSKSLRKTLNPKQVMI